jgi:phage terminase large subunit-like protein
MRNRCLSQEWCAVVDEVPADLDIVRYWDLAATEKTEFNDPDWTIGVKLGLDRSRGYWVLDVVRARANPGDVELSSHPYIESVEVIYFAISLATC